MPAQKSRGRRLVARLFVEIMRRRPPLADEVVRQIKMARLPVTILEPQQREFNFLMPAFAAPLARIGAERFRSSATIALQNVQQARRPAVA